MRNKLHPVSILRHSYKLSLVNAISYVLQIPVSIYVASTLGPENYGLIAFVMLWAFYGRLIRPGLLASAAREMPHYIGKEERKHAIIIQNVCITYEFIYYIFVSVIFIIASFFFKVNVIRIGLILVAVSFLLDIADCSFMNAQWVFQRFNIITRNNLLKVIITPLLTLALVFLLNVYGLLVLPAVISIFSIIYFLFFAPKLNFAITLDFKKIMPLLKVGISLQVLTFLFWSFRGIDRTVVAMRFSIVQLGFYTFAVAYLNNIHKLISDFGNVLSPIIMSELGREGHTQLLQKEFNQLCIILTIVGCFMTNLAQAGFGAMVFWFVPNFIPSISIFEVLAFNIIFTAILVVPLTILQSALINKQNFCNLVYGVVLLLSFLLASRITNADAGIMKIAYLFVGMQIAVTISILALCGRYLFKNKAEYYLFCLLTISVLFLTVINQVIFSTGAFQYTKSHVLAAFINRTSYALLCWGGVFFIMYRLFTRDKFLVKLIKEKILPKI